MEDHKRQAFSSHMLFGRTSERQEFIDSSLCWTEASFLHLLHNTLLRQICALDASHLFKIELPL